MSAIRDGDDCVKGKDTESFGYAHPHIDLSSGHDGDSIYESFGHNSHIDGVWNDIWREPTPTVENPNLYYGEGRKLGGREFFYERIGNVCRAISRNNDLMTSFFQLMNDSNGSTSSSLKDEKIMSISYALAKLFTLEELVPGSQEFSFAVTIIEDPRKRLVLAKMTNKSEIVGWIKFMYAMQKSD